MFHQFEPYIIGTMTPTGNTFGDGHCLHESESPSSCWGVFPTKGVRYVRFSTTGSPTYNCHKGGGGGDDKKGGSNIVAVSSIVLLLILLLIAFAVYYFGCRKPTQRMPGEYVSHNACASSSNFEQTMQMAPVAPQMGQPQMLPPHMAQPQMVSPQMVSPQMAPPQMAPPQMAPSQAGQPPPRFDPYTGQPIQPPPKFDPYTGQPILMVEAAPVVVP